MKLLFLFFNFSIFGNEISTEIILGVITIVVAILFGIPGYKTWREQTLRINQIQISLYKDGWIKASKLSYSSLDLSRDKKAEQFPSCQKGISDSIRRILDKNGIKKHILLLGPSLSGKTHITVSILKEMRNTYVLVPNEATFNQLFKDVGYKIPDTPKNAQHKIILLDNFHEFFKGNIDTIKALIRNANEKNYTIWANCISIEEYDKVKNHLDFKDINLFQFVELQERLTTNEAKKIARNINVINLPASFNGLIGEIYYQPDDIIKHYEDLKTNIVDLDVLISIKQAYMLGAFTLPYQMELELIKRKFDIKYNSDNIQLSSYSKLMKSLKNIEGKGFIKFMNDKKISFESVWLNVIVEPKMRAREFYHDWDKIIPRNVVTYTRLIFDSTDYSEAESCYKEMIQDEIVPDLYSYNLLLSLSPNYETAFDWYSKIKIEKADVFTYNCLINKSPDFETALAWFNKIEKGKENLVTYNSLIKKSPKYDTALNWFNKIENGSADVITYNTLINKSPDYETALFWFSKIESGKTTLNTYNSLIKRSPDYETALYWFEKIEAEKVDVITYSSLIQKSPNYDTALNWFNKIDKGKANKIIYNSLINKSPCYETALEWFNKINIENLDVINYNSIIKKSPNYKTALEWFNKIEAEKADVVTYSSLIVKSPDYDTALLWLHKIETQNKQVDEYTFGALINLLSKSSKTNKYQLAISIHNDMLRRGIQSNVIVFTILIRLSPDFEQAFKLLELMITKKDKHNKLIIPDRLTRKAIEKKANGNMKLLNKINDWFIENIPKNT